MADRPFDERRFAARLAGWPALLSALGEAAPDCPPALLARAQGAVEELFANTVAHGYGGDGERPVWLAARYEAGELVVRYADAAPAFDPFSRLAAAATLADLPPDERPVGGLGCLLVHGLADAVDWCHRDGRNVITLVFRPR